MACAYRSKADQDDISRDKRFIFDAKDLQCLKYQPDGGTLEEIFKELDEIIIEMIKNRGKNG
jgi:hypothetical protein